MLRRRELLGGLAFMGAFGRSRSASAAQSPAAAVAPPLPRTHRMIQSIDGPLVVTESLAAQRDLFEGGFGLALVADQELDPSTTNALFGVPDRSARTIVLQTAGTSVGVRLVEFRPAARIAVREGARPIDGDALKVIDFMVTDFDRAVEGLAARGFRLAAPPAEYSTPADGRFTEGHVQGPDGVVCALLKMHDTPISKYVTVANRTFSEILGVSAPVSDRDPALSFYRDVLQLETVLSYEIANESFQKMLGSKEKTILRGANFGVGMKAPMIGVIHYGLPQTAFASLRSRAILPNRGLLALRFSVPSVDEVDRKARAADLPVLAPITEAVLFPEGRVKSLLLRAPHGVIHQFTEVLKA